MIIPPITSAPQKGLPRVPTGIWSIVFLISFSITLLFLNNSWLRAHQNSSDLPTSHLEERKEFTSELPIDNGFLPYLGTHYYDVFLQDVLIGRATVEVQKTDGEYQIKVNAKTRSVLNSLYKVRYRGEVSFLTDPLKPINASILEQTGSKSKHMAIEFDQSDKVSVVEIEQKGKKPATRKMQNFESDGFILDPFSTVYLIRSIDWRAGLTEIFDVVTGNKQYELRLICKGISTLNINEETRDAWVITPQIKRVGKESDPKDPAASLWEIYVSRDEMREILKISGNPKIGRVVAQMRKFEKIF